MSFDTMVSNATKGVTKFWLGAVQRYKNAKALGPGYTANNLAADLVGSWTDAFDAWASFFELGPTPVVPTVFFSDAAANFVNQKPKRSASLSFSVPAAPLPQSTALLAVGGASIAANLVDVTANDTEVDVVLKIVALPALGVYQGVAYLPPPLSRVLVQIVVIVL